MPTVRILGTHGVPANYGGFETAAENVAKHLVAHGWRVVVYCQAEGTGPTTDDIWQGIERVTIPVSATNWLGTALFDLRSIRHASRHRDVCLTFGYNTGILNVWQRIKGIPNVINMDGIEWSRKRWGFARQAILYVNERFSAAFGNHLIADHPEIEKYLRTRARRAKISTVTYGADAIPAADAAHLAAWDLNPGKYLTIIARPIPENSILELVRAFSHRPRGMKLVVLGNYEPATDDFHRQVVEAASDEVVFAGAVYDQEVVRALRFYTVGYLHGHTVGGTNPSLVEALAAGNPVIAQDNKYNRWVAQDAALYFSGTEQAEQHITTLLADPQKREQMRAAALERHRAEFTWERVAGQYEEILARFAPERA